MKNFIIQDGILIQYTGPRSVEELVIPEGVTEILETAFSEFWYDKTYAQEKYYRSRGMCGLFEVKLPEGLRRIGDNVFNGFSITRINMPSSLEYIGETAFYQTSLRELTLPAKAVVADGAFSSCTLLTKVHIEGDMSVYGKGVFRNCTRLEHITFSRDNATTSIPFGSFRECKSIQEIILPDSLKVIETGSFIKAGISKIIFPDGIIRIEDEAFWDAALPREINLPDSIECIEEGAFSGTKGLEKAIMPKHLKILNKDVFENSHVEEVILPEALEVIEYAAFRGASKLKGIELPNTLKCIKKNAFENTTSLEKIILPDSVTYVDEGVFKKSGIKKIKFGDNQSVIEAHTCEECEFLEDVVLPSKCVAIMYNAFAMARSLKGINLPKNIMSIGVAAFKNSALKEINIPDSVQIIGESAFERCIYMRSASIPNKLLSLKANTFNNCEIKTINIPGNIIEIDATAFPRNAELHFEESRHHMSISCETFKYAHRVPSALAKKSANILGSNIYSSRIVKSGIENICSNASTLGDDEGRFIMKFKSCGTLKFDLSKVCEMNDCGVVWIQREISRLRNFLNTNRNFEGTVFFELDRSEIRTDILDKIQECRFVSYFNTSEESFDALLNI